LKLRLDRMSDDGAGPPDFTLRSDGTWSPRVGDIGREDHVLNRHYRS
jgi:hypothetical protein